jgi:hypothetical protein
MPNVLEIGDVIAERRLTFQPHEGAPQDVTVRSGRPVLDESAPHETWICPFQIEGIGSGKTRGMFGADAMQALLLAIHTIPVELAVCIRDSGGQFLHLANPMPASSRPVELQSNTPETNFHMVKVDDSQCC